MHIYGLVDPRDKSIRYVGRTVDLEYRLSQHITDRIITKKTKWISDLKNSGYSPEIVLLATCLPKDAHRLEYSMIKFGKSMGWKLTNTSGMKGRKYNTLASAARELFKKRDEIESSGLADRLKSSLFSSWIFFSQDLREMAMSMIRRETPESRSNKRRNKMAKMMIEEIESEIKEEMSIRSAA